MAIEVMQQYGMFEGAGDAPAYRWEQQRATERAGAALSDVTVLSFGAGQDSTYLFHRLWYDDEFRHQYAPGRLYIVHADTGDEHEETYEHVERIKRICWERSWDFTHITADMGFHLQSWQTLMGQMYRNDSIMSTTFPRTCTDNLKLAPIYKWLALRLSQDYAGVPDPRGKVFQAGKSMRAFVERYGRVQTILGIAAGEERRMYGSMGGWRGQIQVREYPMVYDGIDRLAAIEATQEWGEVVPPPSHCMRCHFQGPQQILLLAREHPDKWAEWVEREAAKIRRWAHRGKKEPPEPNYGVYGERLLPQVLADAEAAYGHMTTEELRQFAFTRGCSTVSY